MVQELNHIFGSWGDFTFVRRVTPEQGTFTKSTTYKYARNRTLGGRDSLQPLGKELMAVSFIINIKNFVMTKPLLTRQDRIVGLTGLPVSQFIAREADFETLYDDIDAIIRTLTEIANEQTPHSLFEGSNFLGLFILENFREVKTHYRNGESRTSSIDLNFLEWVEEVV